MNKESKKVECETEDYETPNIIGDIDTVEEEIEYLEKKIKIPVVIWMILIVAVALVTLYLTSNQSPTLTI